MLRVLHLDHTQSPGGAELALRRIVLNSHRWAPTVFTPPEDVTGEPAFSGLTTRVRVREVGPRQISGASKAASALQIFGFGARIIGQAIAVRLKEDFRLADVVHVNTSRAAIYGALACWMSRKKLVVHLRDLVDSASLGKVGYFAFTQVALRRADGVIANSQTSLESARNYLPAKSLHIVIASPMGVELATSSRASDTVTRVGMVARLDSWKGQDLVIRAFAKVFSGSSTTLVLAGSPAFGNEAYEDELKVLARELGISRQVEFLGHVENVSACIDSLDICIQSSLRPEPLGQNVLQYLARGKAVIAANEGGPTEWIEPGENGILFEARSVHSLEEALARLAADRELRQRLSSAALMTAGLMSDEASADLHGQFFDRVHDGP